MELIISADVFSGKQSLQGCQTGGCVFPIPAARGLTCGGVWAFAVQEKRELLYHRLVCVTHTVLPAGFLSTGTKTLRPYKVFCEVPLYLTTSTPLLCRKNTAHQKKKE